MIGTRHENYRDFTNRLPFVLSVGLERTPFNCSREQNWHENMELELCTAGEGEVLLNGEKYSFHPGDIVVINSNVIHYTCTGSSLTYTCLIISTDFCKQMGIDYDRLSFTPLIRSASLAERFGQLTENYLDHDAPFRIAKLNQILLELLIELGTHYSCERTDSIPKNKAFEAVKAAIVYIRNHYDAKITLEDLSKAVLFDKYALCREFRKITGQTIVAHINSYRCQRASEYLKNGYSVGETAALCGFENLSFFTKTFKKHMGMLPSACKKNTSET